MNNAGEAGVDPAVSWVVREVSQVGTATDWAKVACGWGFSVALKSDGTLWTWGSGRGVLADGDASGWVPKQIGVDTDWWAIAAGGLGGLATKANGELWGWGNVGATHAPAKPLTEIGDSYGWTTIALSSNDDLAKGGGEENHAMAINTAGDLYTWGSSAQGQLGRDRAYVKEPARITQFE